MERIGSKASDLRLLLNRVDSRKELIDQVNGFFDDAVQQLEARRAELLADIRRHSVAADQQQQLVGVVSEIERLADSAQATPPSAANWNEERLRDVEERLDSCLLREAELLQVGRFDAELARRRMGRLLDGLRIDWHDEWAARRQADNPFAALSAAAAEADADDADSQYEQLEDYSEYRVLNIVNFGAYLGRTGSDDVNAPDEADADERDDAEADAEQNSFAARTVFASRRGVAHFSRRAIAQRGRLGSRGRLRPYRRGGASVENQQLDENSSQSSQCDEAQVPEERYLKRREIGDVAAPGESELDAEHSSSIARLRRGAAYPARRSYLPSVYGGSFRGRSRPYGRGGSLVETQRNEDSSQSSQGDEAELQEDGAVPSASLVFGRGGRFRGVERSRSRGRAARRLLRGRSPRSRRRGIDSAPIQLC